MGSSGSPVYKSGRGTAPLRVSDFRNDSGYPENHFVIVNPASPGRLNFYATNLIPSRRPSWWNDLPKLNLKIFHALVDAVLSRGFYKPRELLFVSLFRLLLLGGGFCHTATQI